MDFHTFIQQRIDKLPVSTPPPDTKSSGPRELPVPVPSSAQTRSAHAETQGHEAVKPVQDREAQDLRETLTFLKKNTGPAEHDFIMLQLLISEEGTPRDQLAPKLRALLANTTGDHAAMLKFVGAELLRKGYSKAVIERLLPDPSPAASGPGVEPGLAERKKKLLGGMGDDKSSQTERQKVKENAPEQTKGIQDDTTSQGRKRTPPTDSAIDPSSLSSSVSCLGPSGTEYVYDFSSSSYAPQDRQPVIETKNTAPRTDDSKRNGAPSSYKVPPDLSMSDRPVAQKPGATYTPNVAPKPEPKKTESSSTVSHFARSSSSSSSSIDLPRRPVTRDDSSPVGPSGLYTPPELEDEHARDFEKLQAQVEAEDQPALEPNPPESKASVRRAPSQSFNADELPLMLSEADPDQLAREAANDPAKRKSYARTVWEGVMNGTITDEWSRKFMATLITGLKQHNGRVLLSEKAVLIASVTVTASPLIRKANKAKNVAQARQIQAASTSIRAELDRLTPEIKPQPLRPKARAKRRNGSPPTT